MDHAAETQVTQSPGLLSPDDPPAFEVVNPEGRTPLLLICDHASAALPSGLESLGLGREYFSRHIAYDIGAAGVARRLAGALDAPAVLGGYSRLIVDLNREPDDPTSIPEVSDGVIIPGNQNLSETEMEARLATLFHPYHDAITAALTRLWRATQTPPALFSIHTFTPRLLGEDERPWDIGVLWNRDPRLAMPLIDHLRALGDLLVGDNEPYSGRETAYSIDRHGGATGLPNCAVEIRQTEVADANGEARWAEILAAVMHKVMADTTLHRVEIH